MVLSDQPIAYPFVQQADVLVALSQEAYSKFRPQAKQEALVLIDEDLVMPFEGAQVHLIPATRLAEELGRRIVTNMVMLGALLEGLPVLPIQSIEICLQNHLPTRHKHLLEMNYTALHRGAEFARQAISIP